VKCQFIPRRSVYSDCEKFLWIKDQPFWGLAYGYVSNDVSLWSVSNSLRHAADAKGGDDIVALDVSEPLPLVDIFLLITGRNERNVAAIADEIEEKLLESG
ncbi:RsfS/YbeB/iojap family protein, partial [Vibrio parahaemolyticus]|nr:RsfS/YbeB/iojap family protein [Vibrio parahaemolyticus]